MGGFECTSGLENPIKYRLEQTDKMFLEVTFLKTGQRGVIGVEITL